MRILFNSLYSIFGFCFLFLGLVGVFVPLLPTAPFVLLSAYCFSRSSKRFHKYLLQNSWSGPLIRDWREQGAIPLYGKVAAFFTVGISACWILLKLDRPVFVIGIELFLFSILLFIMTRPTSRRN